MIHIFSVLWNNYRYKKLNYLIIIEIKKDEIIGCLDFIQYVYDVFGFKFELALSTRPDNFIGDVKNWDKAEDALREALNKTGKEWKINPGDGAFYGPKIDIKLFDAFERGH